MRTTTLLLLCLTACGPLEHPPCETSDAGVVDAGEPDASQVVDAGPSCTSCFCDVKAAVELDAGRPVPPFCINPPVGYPCCEGLADGMGGVKP